MSRIWLAAVIVILGNACLANTSTPVAEDTPAVAAEGDALSTSVDPCAVVRCRAGYECVSHGRIARCVPAPECKVDSDCQLYSDYCEGCNCIALAPGEKAPVCHGTTVQCFVDPCRSAVATCEQGSCVAGSGAATF